uniref:Seminal fluid protein HACP025 n=1 Tax=Heliconius erato TaxID=33431 RepID=D9HQ39_HELEA|nr:seminal fluid protein HACP025 [Heliconius erato]
MKFRNFFMILFLAIISSSMASALRAEQKSELDPADLKKATRVVYKAASAAAREMNRN